MINVFYVTSRLANIYHEIYCQSFICPWHLIFSTHTTWAHYLYNFKLHKLIHLSFYLSLSNPYSIFYRLWQTLFDWDSKFWLSSSIKKEEIFLEHYPQSFFTRHKLMLLIIKLVKALPVLSVPIGGTFLCSPTGNESP